MALPLAAVLLLGCQATAPLEHSATATGLDRVWPAPESGDPARFAYRGALIGERNYRTGQAERRGALASIGRWLLGVTGRERPDLDLQRPQSGAIDATGRVLVVDASRQAVVVFDPVARDVHEWTWAGRGRRFESPVGIALGPAGRSLVTDAALGEVVVLDARGRPEGALGAGLLGRPTGIARDAVSGFVYVADTERHDIKVFDAGGALVRTIGRRGTAPGEFNYPTHLAFAAGELYVTDSLNARIQVLDAAGLPLRSFGERGLHVGDLVRPKGVAVDATGHVYVVESLHSYLLVFDHDGRLLLPIGGVGAGVGEFYLPAGVWVGPGNEVYVADMFNGRVVMLASLGAAP